MIRPFLKVQLRYSWPILGIFLVLVLFALTYLPDFTIDPSLSSLVSDNSEFNTNDRILSNTYTTNNIFSIVLEPDANSRLENRISDLNDSRVHEYAENLREVMMESRYVEYVGPLTVNQEGTYAKVDVFVSVPRRILGFQAVIDDLNLYLSEAGTIPGVKTTLSGFSVLLTRINSFLVLDNIKAIGFTAVALFLMLFWYFRRIRFTLITMAVPSISLIFVMALMAILEIPLTITLAAVGVLLLSLGVDYAIHVSLAYEANCSGSKDKEEAIIEAGDHLSKAILASFITTLVGFAALAFGVTPSSQGQGLVLALGISVVFLVTAFLLPSLLYRFAGSYCPRENNAIKVLKSRLVSLSAFQTNKPKTVLLLLLVATAFMMFGASKVKFSTSNNNWVPDDDPVAVSFRTQSLAFGNDFSSLTVVIQSTGRDLRDINTVRDIQGITALLEGLNEVVSVESPFNGIELDQAAITETFSQEPLRGRFNKDYTLTTLSVRVTDFAEEGAGGSSLRDEIFQIFDENPIYFAEVSYFGDTIRFAELGDSLQRDTLKTTLIAFSLVFIVSAISYASIMTGFIALLPVLVGIIWTVGLMGFLSIPFTSLSSGLIALVLGIGVDFSIHLVNSTQNGLKKGKSLALSLRDTISYTGTPILLSSATTFIGFLSLLLGTLLGIQRLGMSLALSIVSVFIVTIVMVPALLALGNRNKTKSRRKVVKA